MTTKTLTAGALFAGIGGFCLGFKRAGINTSWAIENDVGAVSTYMKNFPGVRIVTEDNEPADIRSIHVATHDLQPVDILHAGFPCQSFSTAGERKGFNDPRGMLFFEILRIVREFGEDKPSVIVLENSPHIRVGDGGAWFIELMREIKKAGYWFRDANCAELDPFRLTELPQKRNRLFMVAFSTSAFKNGKIEFPSQAIDKPKRLEDYIAFDGMIDDESYYLKEGNRYHKMISEKLDDPYCIYQLRKFLVRIKEPGVCPTLTANMGLGGHNVPFIFDKKGLRKLTERECLNLQGYPAEFEFPADLQRWKRYTQVGNSVVPLVSHLLGELVRNKIERERL